MTILLPTDNDIYLTLIKLDRYTCLICPQKSDENGIGLYHYLKLHHIIVVGVL